MAKPRLFVQAGQRIGHGVVIDPEIRVKGYGKNKTRRGARLLCDCGNEYTAPMQSIVGSQPETFSCGCLSRARLAAGRLKGPEAVRGKPAHNFKDQTGQRFGMLLVLEHAGSKQRPTGKMYSQWLCRCDCGTQVILPLTVLTSGNTKSCGCATFALRRPAGTSARNRVLKAYKGAARRRGLAWALTDEDFDKITAQACHYCGCPPSARSVQAQGRSEFTYNGIDRVDNAIGYIPGNVVPACSQCNYAKKDMPYDEFMAWIARLTEYHFFHPELTPSRLLKGGA